MKKLSLHASGLDDYLDKLKESYEHSVMLIRQDPKLTDIERKEKLKKLQDAYILQKKNSRYSLFSSG